MKNVIHLADVKGTVDVELLEFKIAFTAQVVDVRDAPGEEIIDGDDRVAFGKQRVTKMGAEKSSAAGDERARFHEREIFLAGFAPLGGAANSALIVGRPTL